MIRKFRHKGLERFFRKSDPRGIAAAQAERLRRLLDRLDAIRAPGDMDLPGLHFHELKGNRRGTYAVRVSGNWRLTFRFDGQDCLDVDLEDYH